jgi:hypothetical protein
VSEKLSRRAAARELYTSPLFRKSRRLAESRFSQWFVLSAKHGLVHPDTVLSPYDETLAGAAADVRRRWTDLVATDVLKATSEGDTLCFLAGASYRRGLVPILEQEGRLCVAPLSDLGIGRQLQWLTLFETSGERLAHLDRFYGLLRRLSCVSGGMPRLGECTGQRGWPRRGVYFFFEDSEIRTTAMEQLRVVRVGTHAVSKNSASTLWGRLRTHRGGGAGLGNHRGSIFRLHIGAALIGRGDVSPSTTWGVGQAAERTVRESEREIEGAVSAYVGALRILWLPVDDDPAPVSDRAYLERQSIALLVGPAGPLDRPTPRWLGRHSRHQTIATSGLWNLNYVDGTYSPLFLDVLEQYVEIAEGTRAMPTHSLAPSGWHSAISMRPQRTLFEV